MKNWLLEKYDLIDRDDTFIYVDGTGWLDGSQYIGMTVEHAMSCEGEIIFRRKIDELAANSAQHGNAEICSDNVCQYCTGDGCRNSPAKTCIINNHIDFKGRKLSAFPG